MIIIQKIVFLDQFGPLGIKIKTWTQNELYGLVVLPTVPTVGRYVKSTSVRPLTTRFANLA